MKTLKFAFIALVFLSTAIACKKSPDNIKINHLIGTWYHSNTLSSQRDITREYSFHPDKKYQIKITFSSTQTGTNQTQTTGEVTESGKFDIKNDTLKFHRERVTSWETGFPGSDRSFNDDVRYGMKYRISGDQLEIEYRGTGAADEPIVSTTVYTKRK